MDPIFHWADKIETNVPIEEAKFGKPAPLKAR